MNTQQSMADRALAFADRAVPLSVTADRREGVGERKSARYPRSRPAAGYRSGCRPTPGGCVKITSPQFDVWKSIEPTSSLSTIENRTECGFVLPSGSPAPYEQYVLSEDYDFRASTLRCDDATLSPRQICPRCGSPEVTREPLSDRGEIVSFTVISVTIPKFHGETPYTVVLV